MKPTRLLLALSLLLPAGACTSKDQGADAEASAEPAASPGGIETIVIAPRPAPTVTVVDAGAEPRMPMRLRPEAGTREALELAISMEMSMRNGAQALPSVPVPTTRTHLSAEVQEVGAEEFSVRHAVDTVTVEAKPGTPQMVIASVEASTKPLTQYRALMRMSDRGAVLGGEVSIPRDLPAPFQKTMQQMTESLGQLAAPLPEEAVGPGAQWTAVYDVAQGGMKLRQTVHYTMVERHDEKASLALTIEQVLLDPAVTVPGMLGTTRVSDFESSGRGTMQLDLRHVTPASMHMVLDISMAMDVSVLGQDQHMEMEMSMDMTMTRAAEG